MKQSIFCLLAIVGVAVAAEKHSGAAEAQLFVDGWQFSKGEQPGAEETAFDDSGWRTLRLPHDWAIEGPFSNDYNARCGGLPYHGTGWYRKTFQAPDRSPGDRVAIRFDGAMADAHVWVNGQFVGNRPYGYISFEFDITRFLNDGDADNVVAVRLQPKEDSSRWYPGAGLYRNVWLTVRPAVHVPLWGVGVTTPVADADEARVVVETQVANTSAAPRETIVRQTILSPAGEVVATGEQTLTVAASETAAVKTDLRLTSPELWSIEAPNQYTLLTEIRDASGGATIGTTRTRFGVRSIAFDAERGFFLNGERVVLKGVCLHHDLGPLGAAVNRRATERQIEIMQQMGVNAIRTAHNPPSPELLELCDEHGMLVIDEAFDCWAKGKVPNDYHTLFDEWHERDLVDLVRRDRNHPCVIMWSLGNEILEQRVADGWKLAKRLHDICHKTDPSRPTTAGFDQYPDALDNRLAEQFDVVGLNYKPMYYERTRREYPDVVLYGSETASTVSSRGVYHFPFAEYEKHDSKQITSYDFIAPNWACPPDYEFAALDANPSVLGEFVWTGFDYLGEPTPYGGFDHKTKGKWNVDWPARSSYFGCVDLCGLRKDRFYLYQSRWTDEPMIHLVPQNWNWQQAEADRIPVVCYTNADEAELFLNGKSLGRKVLGKDTTQLPVGGRHIKHGEFETGYRVRWDVAYEPGELTVVGYQGGEEVARDRVATAGEPAVLELTADRRTVSGDSRDLVFVTVRVLDADGELCPAADNQVDFRVAGGGRLVAVGNGNAASTASFQATSRKAFSGKCVAILAPSDQQPGDFQLTASSQGLTAASITISVLPESTPPAPAE